MKLAEALMLRADALKKIAQLKNRLTRSAKVQEGENPSENPQELLQELNQAVSDLTNITQQINKTNSATVLEGSKTLTDALAERDSLALKRAVLVDLIEAASVKQDRYSRSEVKFISTVEIAKLQKEVDLLAKQYRELDTRIQQINWTVDLI